MGAEGATSRCAQLCLFWTALTAACLLLAGKEEKFPAAGLAVGWAGSTERARLLWLFSLL